MGNIGRFRRPGRMVPGRGVTSRSLPCGAWLARPGHISAGVQVVRAHHRLTALEVSKMDILGVNSVNREPGS